MTFQNRLAQEKSPYLRQHANNPVDWYPWGEEAFAEAKKGNKPIFLSIGYSACHWCHVMAHESFENEAIAATMNKYFINIKVDREERPDVDAIYMTAVQALTGAGGWPMSVWLTPDLKPFYAGTYFPPDDRHGRPGFPHVLEQLADHYKKDPKNIGEVSENITRALVEMSTTSLVKSKDLPSIQDLRDQCFRELKANFDAEWGGFGRAPKFPMPIYLEFLLWYSQTQKNNEALKMAEITMQKMAEGGLYDQLGGGFARYSTDEKWLVPHFEKMLYDNSQLVAAYAKLFEQTKNPEVKNVLEETVEYTLRDLRHEQGGFYSAEDADSEGKEGAFYLWTLEQFQQTLPENLAPQAKEYYQVTVQGNFFDPHSQEEGQNILTAPRRFQNANPADKMKNIKKNLFLARTKRPRPFRDEKIITEWNALMIGALVEAGRALGRPDWIHEAKKTAQFIKTNLFDSDTNTLYRRWMQGERAIEGQQVDYAMMIHALLNLYAETQRYDDVLWAELLHKQQDSLFYDDRHGGYFMSRDQKDLLVRMKDDTDNVIPSGNSMAVVNAMRLFAITNKEEYRHRAGQVLLLFGGRLTSRPSSLPLMLQGLNMYSLSLQN